METGAEGDAPGFPTPQELWAKTFAVENARRDRILLTLATGTGKTYIAFQLA
jgi:type I restriction enzyme, R subunit